MDIKRQEIVYNLFFFFKSTASREKMRNVFENSFPLYGAEAPFLSFSHHLCLLTLTILETKHLLHLSCKPG